MKRLSPRCNVIPVIGRADTLTPAELAEIDAPVWIVAGALDQLGIDARAYTAAARDGRRRIIPRATHLAPITHPLQVAAVLREAVLDTLHTPAE